MYNSITFVNAFIFIFCSYNPSMSWKYYYDEWRNKMSTEQLIHNAAMKIMNNIGIEIHNEKALQVYKEHGIRTEGSTVFFTEDQVWEWVKKAPSEFTVYARNPEYDVHIGGNNVNVAPSYGCAFIQDRDGTVRRGTLEDYVKFTRAVHGLEEYSINGGITVSPADMDGLVANVGMFYATLLNSDKAILIGTGTFESMKAILEAGCALFGGKEAMAERPRMFTLINTNSPLSLADNMLQCTMAMVEYGQPVIFCPASMLGATAPIKIAGSLASNTCEVLAGIILAQMLRPGTPVVFGIQSTALDMKTVGFACAAPEGALMQGFGADMARFYGLPSRGGGSQTDSPIINVQAGYESMLTCFSAHVHGINVVMECGGVLDSVNSTSFDKLLIDAEIIRQCRIALAPIVVDEEGLDYEEIEECGHTANFMECDCTLDNFRDLYSPHIGTRSGKYSDNEFLTSLDNRMAAVLKTAENTKPALNEDMKIQIKEILNRECGITQEQLEIIEAL